MSFEPASSLRVVLGVDHRAGAMRPPGDGVTPLPGHSLGSVPGAGVTAALHCWVVRDIKEPRPIGQRVATLPAKLEASGKKMRQLVLKTHILDETHLTNSASCCCCAKGHVALITPSLEIKRMPTHEGDGHKPQPCILFSAHLHLCPPSASPSRAEVTHCKHRETEA